MILAKGPGGRSANTRTRVVVSSFLPPRESKAIGSWFWKTPPRISQPRTAPQAGRQSRAQQVPRAPNRTSRSATDLNVRTCGGWAFVDFFEEVGVCIAPLPLLQ